MGCKLHMLEIIRHLSNMYEKISKGSSNNIWDSGGLEVFKKCYQINIYLHVYVFRDYLMCNMNY